MRILQIMTTRLGHTGISTYVLNIIKHIDTSKYKVDYIFVNNPSDEIKKILNSKGSSFYVLSNRTSNPLNYFLKLNELLKKQNYRAVHIHGNSHTMAIELWAAKINKVTVRIAHAHSTSTNFKILHNLLSTPFKRALTHGVSSSDSAGKWLFFNEYYEVMPIGIIPEKFKFRNEWRQEYRKSLGINEDEILIGHVGMYTENKNQSFLIKLLTHLSSKYKLLLIGKGEKKEECKQLAVDLGVDKRVIFYGESDNVNQLYSAMDMFILPSYYEGLGLVLIEAQTSDLTSYASNGVPNEANITKEVEKINIEDDLKKTAFKIYGNKTNRPCNRVKQKNFQKVYNSDYNMVNSIKKLESFYKRTLENKNIL